jgi:hypothetical protein
MANLDNDVAPWIAGEREQRGGDLAYHRVQPAEGAAGAVVIRREVNQGTGAALATGFCRARAPHPDAIVTLDAGGPPSRVWGTRCVATAHRSPRRPPFATPLGRGAGWGGPWPHRQVADPEMGRQGSPFHAPHIALASSPTLCYNDRV